MKALIWAVTLAAAPLAAWAGPYSVEVGLGAAQPATSLKEAGGVTSPLDLQSRRATKAALAPYVSVMREGPARLRFRLTYRHFDESRVGNPNPTIITPVCTGNVCPDFVAVFPGHQMTFSDDAIYAGVTRDLPMGRILSFEADIDAGLGFVHAHGLSRDGVAAYPYGANDSANFTFGGGAGLRARLTSRASLVGKVDVFSLGKAMTGAGTGLPGGGQTLQGHPTAVTGTIGLRIAL